VIVHNPFQKHLSSCEYIPSFSHCGDFWNG